MRASSRFIHPRFHLVMGVLMASAPAFGQAASGPEQLIKLVVDEKGQNENGSWEAHYEKRFRLSLIWNGTAGTGSPATLYRTRGSLLGLKKGERLQYYEAETTGHGVEHLDSETYPMQLSLSADGRYALTMEGRRTVEDDASFRSERGIPQNANWPGVGRAYRRQIDLERTKDGVVVQLTSGALGSPDSPAANVFPGSSLGLVEGLREQVLAGLLRFELSNAELQKTSSISRTKSGSASKERDRFAVTVTLSVVSEEDDAAEVTVEPVAFKHWLPAANLANPKLPGAQLTVRVRVHQKGHPDTPKQATLEFALTQVSHEKGVCLNWPARGAGAEADLWLRPEDNAKLAVKDEAHAASDGPTEAVELVVSARDFGAYGVLTVTAKDEQQRVLKVTVDGRETPDLSIPQDDNHNHIADDWELQWVGDLHGEATTDDDAKPAGRPGTDGDGLSLYEEYRGFVVHGAQLRGDPKWKDLFVSDRTTGSIAGPGIELFRQATELAVHTVMTDELGGDRVINRNAGTGHVVTQHGLLMVDGPADSDPEQFPASARLTTFGPPGDTLYVRLPVGSSWTSGDAQADVAHELSHAVGLQHHGAENAFPVDWFWKQAADGSWQLYEQRIEQDSKGAWSPTGAARPIQALWEPTSAGATAQPFQRKDGPPAGSATVGPEKHWRLYVGGEKSQWSGDQECLMRYYDKQAYLSKADPARVRYLPDPKQWRMRHRLCTTAKGTGVNAADHFPQPRYGDAAVGKCKAQLVVNDKFMK